MARSGLTLGEVIDRFDDETVVSETLFALGDLQLIAQLTRRAAEQNLSLAELATQLVGRFVNNASDEDWLTLVGQMSHAEDPSGVFLHRALNAAAAA